MTNPEASLFDRYRPDVAMGAFSGRIVYGLFEVDETYGRGVQFMCTFELEGGLTLACQYPEIDRLIQDLLAPVFGDRLAVSVMEGTHAVYLRDLDDSEDLEETDLDYQDTVRKIDYVLTNAGAFPFALED